MKTLHFASILTLVAVTAFACNDDEDRKGLPKSAGSTSEAGASGKDDGSGGSAVDIGGAGAPPSITGGAAGAESGGEAGSGGGNVGGAGAPAGGAGPGGAGAGDAGAGGAVSEEPLELIGAYDDNYGGSFVITTEAWGTSAIAAYDNAQNVVYTQFPASDPYSPNKFAKTVYTEPANDSFYFCMVVYSAVTLAEAQASAATADPSDPDNGGCGGQFPWSKATKQ